MPDQAIGPVIAALGIVVGYIIKALFDRHHLNATARAAVQTAGAAELSAEAEADAANAAATAAIISAARELVDPLRKELTLERAEVGRVRKELSASLEEIHELRREVAHVRQEAAEMEAAYQRRIEQLEAELQARAEAERLAAPTLPTLEQDRPA